MNFSNAFIVGILSIIMAELQSMQGDPLLAFLFGFFGLVLIILDFYFQN